MALFDTIRAGASGQSTGYDIERSIRMDGSNGYLLRTPTTTGNRKVWTWSGWVKRTRLDNNDYIFSCNSQSGNDGIAALYWKSGNNKLQFYFDTDGSNPYGDVNNREYRDVTNWYHIVWQVDANNTTHRIWVNGVEENITGGQPPNYSYAMNRSGYVQAMGTQGWDSHTQRGHMYFAECHYSDGNKYEASDFGEYDSQTGQWVAKKPNITYGTNGFYLKFSDNSSNTATTIGKDYSGNGNNWTPNGISVAAWPDNDSVIDTPTNNFATLNVLDRNGNVNTTNGALETASTTGGAHFPIFTSMSMYKSKYYFEYKRVNNDDGMIISIMNIEHDAGSLNTDSTPGNNTSAVNKVGFGLLVGSGRTSHNGTLSSPGAYGSALGANEIGMCAVDLDNGKIWWGKDGTFFNSGDPANGTNAAFTTIDTNITWNFCFHVLNNNNLALNWGQQGFSHTPPTGFNRLCSADLAEPAVKNATKHFDIALYTGTGSSQNITGLKFQPDWVWCKNRSSTNRHALFDAIRGVTIRLASDRTDEETADPDTLTSFNSNGFSIGADTGQYGVNQNNSNFVSWNWNAGNSDGKTYTVKVVSDSGNKYRFDDFGTSAVTLDLAEGGTYIFDQSDSSNSGHPLRFSTTSNGTHGGGSEYTTGVTTSGTPGSSGAYTQIVVAASAPTLYYYCTQHSGMGGQANTNSTLGSSNFDGNNQATVKANPTAGFSIVGYVGTGQNSTDVTMGHGLNVTPAAVIIKKRGTGGSEAQWGVLHQKLTSGKNIFLQTTTGESTYSNQIKSMQSSTFTVNTADASAGRYNRSGENYIAYVFSEVEGYSKFGKYSGNGSSNGTFIYLGFRPAYFLLTRIDSGDNRIVKDSARNPNNDVFNNLQPNATNAENGSAGNVNTADFLSNGVKLRGSDSGINSSSGTYIYFAFAESSLKYSRAR